MRPVAMAQPPQRVQASAALRAEQAVRGVVVPCCTCGGPSLAGRQAGTVLHEGLRAQGAPLPDEEVYVRACGHAHTTHAHARGL